MDVHRSIFVTVTCRYDGKERCSLQSIAIERDEACPCCAQQVITCVVDEESSLRDVLNAIVASIQNRSLGNSTERVAARSAAAALPPASSPSLPACSCFCGSAVLYQASNQAIQRRTAANLEKPLLSLLPPSRDPVIQVYPSGSRQSFCVRVIADKL